MSLKVLIVPDKFKGTLTAPAAAAAIARGWRAGRPQDTLELLPMSDGGDGFGEVLASLLTVVEKSAMTLDSAHRPCQAKWWWEESTRTAIIESAQVIGLALLPPGRFHPFEIDTYGLGAVWQAALALGASQCLVGIGGSATNDGGFGFARALGWTFLDADDQALVKWTEMDRLCHIIRPAVSTVTPEVVVAVDVQNPLLGPTGASRIYGPQKGLRAEDFALAEACLCRLVEIVKQDLHIDAASQPGTGAAGGLGYGLRCFLDAHLESGFKIFARYARLPERIRAAQLVITGEGAIDESTLMGKGVGEVAQRCRASQVPCIGLAGMFRTPDVLNAERPGCFTQAYAIAPAIATPEQARRDAAIWLARLAAGVAKAWRA